MVKCPTTLAIQPASRLKKLGRELGSKKDLRPVKPLRVGITLEQPLEVGGGFQQSLNDLLWFCGWAKSADTEVVVFTPHAKSISLLSDLGIKAELLKAGILDHLALLLKYSRAFDLLQAVLRIRSPYERRLMARGIDLVYFTTPSNWHLLLYKLPFIITIFDGCHRDAPEFDEVREFGEFERREMLFRSAATKAALVVVNAEQLIDALSHRYGMEPDRAVCVPLSPSTYVGRSIADSRNDDASVLAKYKLEPNYLFYPAQFWPHKNHATLLAALALLRERGVKKRLVLCGSDRGARSRLEALIVQYNLTDQVSILGFVDSAELGALYHSALALVMPTYFGPTNLPPLEAWAVGTPVIYPEAFKAYVGNAAILFDYDSPASLADAIVSLDSADLCAQLRLAGTERLKHYEFEIDEGHRQFALHMERLKHRISLTRRTG
jgi:glycosyltransferase involved in cell wall biosynthesis